MPGEKNMIRELSGLFEIGLRDDITFQELRNELSAHINYLITADFNRLISLLYRLDISETKIKTMIRDNAGTDASLLLADLIIERQIQKQSTRKQFRQTGENNIDENEKW